VAILTRVTPILIVTIFLTSLLIVPSVFVFGGSSTLNSIDGPFESQALISQLSHDARVAIYNEDNLTAPVMCLAENLTNNIAEITTLLEGAGHTVDALTEEDILNHELNTDDYDVFILVNNVPRPSISKLVKEFWLGGGGLLSFNGAMSFLWYEEIIYPGYALDPRPGSWDYRVSDVLNVTARHPTMNDFHVNDTFTQSVGNWAVVAQASLDSSDLSSYFTTLLANASTPNHVSAFALDSYYKGGRVVHLPGDGSSIGADLQSIIVDSVEWIIPQPKGRIAFDYTHQPRIGIDSWDTEYVTVNFAPHIFEQFRNLAVNHSYTFDKLYPSSAGNITAARLAPYDVFIMAWPDINYTSAEGAVIDEWVSGGGSLLVLGDRTGLGFPNDYGDETLNMVLQNFDMSLGTTNELPTAVMTPGTHVTLEGCTGLTLGPRNYLSVLGNATTIWFDGTHPVVAGQEYGTGRAILSADMNIFDDGVLGLTNNRLFANNVLNWLTARDAEILVYSDYLGWNDAVCKALRDLGLSYQFFSDRTYLQDFIDSKEWDLLIYNCVNFATELLRLDELYAFVDDGGRLLMTYWNFDDVSTHPLWSKLGVEYASTLSGDPSMYIWDTTHPIFTEPNDHSMYNYTSTGPFGDDGDAVTVKAGYIALAGTTADVQDGKAAIVVSPDKQTLVNAFLIDNFGSDEDDSTYEDAVELWQNEIVFMMSPGGGLPFNLDPMTLLLIGAIVVVIIVIGVLVSRRRGGGSAPAKKSAKKTTKKKK